MKESLINNENGRALQTAFRGARSLNDSMFVVKEDDFTSKVLTNEQMRNLAIAAPYGEIPAEVKVILRGYEGNFHIFIRKKDESYGVYTYRNGYEFVVTDGIEKYEEEAA